MKRWWLGLGASFALGFALAWYAKPAPPDTAAPVAASAAPAPAAQFGGAWTQAGPVAAAPLAPLPPSAGVDELWNRALSPQGHDAEDRLRKLAQTDPVALRNLLQRYNGAQTPQVLELLKGILSTVQKPEVIAFSTRLAGSMNLAERKYGFELLQSVAPDAPETRALVKRTLSTEQSPEVLVQALATLQSAAAEPEEAAQMVAQLKLLSQHADPAVRSQSITQLGQWDKKGEGADRMSQALHDPAAEVRQAAIFAIAQTGIRTDAVKDALMGLVSNAQESRDIRGSALQVLERFSLTKDEYAAFARARAQLQGS